MRLHNIHAGDRLRYRMLHLDARIHLNEVELMLRIHQELNRARVLIADVGQAVAQSPAHFFAHLRRHLQARRLFNQLLVPPLNRALALKQRHHAAVFIGQHLELDVPRVFDEPLHVELAVAKCVRRLGKCRMKQIRQFV